MGIELKRSILTRSMNKTPKIFKNNKIYRLFSCRSLFYAVDST